MQARSLLDTMNRISVCSSSSLLEMGHARGDCNDTDTQQRGVRAESTHSGSLQPRWRQCLATDQVARCTGRYTELCPDRGRSRCAQGIFRHWAIYNIPKDTGGLAEGAGSHKPDAAIQTARNDFGNAQYDGPQPPPGHGPHHYHFRLFALDVPQLSISARSGAQDVLTAAQAHSLAEADVVCTFGR